MTPQGCADKIRTSPVGSDDPIPARQGKVLCLKTSYQTAVSAGDSQRMILVEVTGIAADGTLALQVTAWNIPR